MRKSKKHIAFIAPGLILYTMFVVFPILYVLYLSLFEWPGLGPMRFIGIQNFTALFADSRIAPVIFHALRNNLKYLMCVWFIITPLQYIIAYLLFIRVPAHRYIKFMIFLPYVVSLTIISFFATLIFNPNIGLLNRFLEFWGFAGGAWFGDVRWSFKLLVFLIFWQGAGSGVMIFYSNMLDISQDIMDACRIDGCKEWQRFFYIFLPLSLPACASIITMSTIWALTLFDLPFILGGSNGGVSGSLDFVNLVFYRYTFGTARQGKSDFGFGASICAVMFVIMMLITFFQNKLLSKFEYDT
jgi:ABC-type sugar transport system permease subunit